MSRHLESIFAWTAIEMEEEKAVYLFFAKLMTLTVKEAEAYTVKLFTAVINIQYCNLVRLLLYVKSSIV